MNRGRGASRRPNRGGGRFNKPKTSNRAVFSPSKEHDVDDDSTDDRQYDDSGVEVCEALTKGRSAGSVKTCWRSSNKALIQTLHMSVENREMVDEVLRDLQITSGDNEFHQSPACNAKEIERNEAYWKKVGERKLLIEGGVTFADAVDGESQVEINDEIYSSYAVQKLLQCGFEKKRCLVALRENDGDVGAALESLLCSCCGLNVIGKENPNYSEENFQQAVLQRREEVLALQSIYGDAFTEVIKDSIWNVKFSLPFLFDVFKTRNNKDNGYNGQKNKKLETSKRVCRFFLDGYCRFDDRCRFSHASSDFEKKSNEATNSTEIPSMNNESADPSFPFILEVRFCKGSLYPFEPPLVAFYSTSESIPSSGCLNVTLRLIREAKDLSTTESPIIFCLTSLLENEEEIMKCFNNSPSEYSLPVKKSITAKSDEMITCESDKKEATPKKPQLKQLPQSSNQLTIKDRNGKLKQQFERLQVSFLGLLADLLLSRVY